MLMVPTYVVTGLACFLRRSLAAIDGESVVGGLSDGRGIWVCRKEEERRSWYRFNPLQSASNQFNSMQQTDAHPKTSAYKISTVESRSETDMLKAEQGKQSHPSSNYLPIFRLVRSVHVHTAQHVPKPRNHLICSCGIGTRSQEAELGWSLDLPCPRSESESVVMHI
ncbi:hypothetical protein BKA80DRAFT_15173 [Phyllosticta citrichinensis]